MEDQEEEAAAELGNGDDDATKMVSWVPRAGGGDCCSEPPACMRVWIEQTPGGKSERKIERKEGRIKKKRTKQEEASSKKHAVERQRERERELNF